jgi:hypothetical protein
LRAGAGIKIFDPGRFGDRLLNPLQEVAHSVSRAGGGRKEESSRIVPLRVLSHPSIQILMRFAPFSFSFTASSTRS